MPHKQIEGRVHLPSSYTIRRPCSVVIVIMIAVVVAITVVVPIVVTLPVAVGAPFAMIGVVPAVGLGVAAVPFRLQLGLGIVCLRTSSAMFVHLMPIVLVRLVHPLFAFGASVVRVRLRCRGKR